LRNAGAECSTGNRHQLFLVQLACGVSPGKLGIDSLIIVTSRECEAFLGGNADDCCGYGLGIFASDSPKPAPEFRIILEFLPEITHTLNGHTDAPYVNIE
jgi:hypothetical protein